jgi:lipopolysaccharide export system permease protein
LINILDRYIFRELLSPFLTSLTALCFIVFTKEMLRLMDLLVSKGVGLFAIGKVIAYLMPSFLVLTLPIACLIASVSAFSRLSFDNELIVMRAAGVSLWRLAVPVFTFSTLVFLLTLFLSQWGQPWSNVSIKAVAMSLIKDQLTLALDSGVFNEPLPNMMVYVPDPKEKQKFQGVFISDQRDPQKPFIIVAQSYQVINDPQRKRFGIRLFEGAIHQIPPDLDDYHQIGFSTYDFWLKLPTRSFGNATRLSYDQIIERLDNTDWNDTGLLRRLMEHYKDLGFPVATLLLGMLGLPVGIVSRRSGRAGGFAIGVTIILGFYLLNVFGEFLVTTRVVHPFVGAWFPNVITLVVTVVMYVRASRQ